MTRSRITIAAAAAAHLGALALAAPAGNGVAGAVVASVLGLIGVVVGGLGLVRSRHTG